MFTVTEFGLNKGYDSPVNIFIRGGGGVADGSLIYDYCMTIGSLYIISMENINTKKIEIILIRLGAFI